MPRRLAPLCNGDNVLDECSKRRLGKGLVNASGVGQVTTTTTTFPRGLRRTQSCSAAAAAVKVGNNNNNNNNIHHRKSVEAGATVVVGSDTGQAHRGGPRELQRQQQRRGGVTMAVEFDHMYIGSGGGEAKAPAGKNLEVQHIKNLLLLHLDLIQQQNEQIIAKDKQIKALKEENNKLRARLERHDRRVSLSLHKKDVVLDSETTDSVQVPKDGTFSLSPKSIKSDPVNLETPKIEEPAFKPTNDTARKTSPKTSTPKTSPRDKRLKRDLVLSENEDEGEEQYPERLDSPISPKHQHEQKEKHTPKRSTDNEVECPMKRSKLEREKRPSISIIDTKPPLDITDHNLRSREKPKEEKEQLPDYDHALPVVVKERPITPNSRTAALEAKKLRQKLLLKGQPVESRSVRGESILNTSVAYYLPYGSSNHHLILEEETQAADKQSLVEIPRWGIRTFTSLYVMEGTENLEDEIFNKRHSKPEIEEKRRKRWDMQRLREQRQYERLRERYEGRHNNASAEQDDHLSLWPCPDNATFLHIDDCLPVCAFGQPLATITPMEFSLPWLSKPPVGVTTRRRTR